MPQDDLHCVIKGLGHAEDPTIGGRLEACAKGSGKPVHPSIVRQAHYSG